MRSMRDLVKPPSTPSKTVAGFLRSQICWMFQRMRAAWRWWDNSGSGAQTKFLSFGLCIGFSPIDLKIQKNSNSRITPFVELNNKRQSRVSISGKNACYRFWIQKRSAQSKGNPVVCKERREKYFFVLRIEFWPGTCSWSLREKACRTDKAARFDRRQKGGDVFVFVRLERNKNEQ